MPGILSTSQSVPLVRMHHALTGIYLECGTGDIMTFWFTKWTEDTFSKANFQQIPSELLYAISISVPSVLQADHLFLIPPII